MNRTDFPDLAAFHAEIKRVQQKAHGQHYTDNHEALQKYGAECPIQKELGVSQGGTLAAMMLTNPEKLTGVDYLADRFNPYRQLFEDYATQHGIEFRFMQRDSLDARTATACDLLHIDSRHTVSHLRQELTLHAPGVSKYIICHDTQAKPELMTVIRMFAGWRVIEQNTKNVGFTVMAR